MTLGATECPQWAKALEVITSNPPLMQIEVMEAQSG